MVRHEERERGAFAVAIRRARIDSGLTQDQVAEEAEGKLSRSTLIRWESGDITDPSLSQLKTFIAVTDAPTEDILRALDLLPDANDDREDLDADEQALWDLGARRGWEEDARWDLIDAWRARKMRQARRPDVVEDPRHYGLAAHIDEDEQIERA